MIAVNFVLLTFGGIFYIIIYGKDSEIKEYEADQFI